MDMHKSHCCTPVLLCKRAHNLHNDEGLFVGSRMCCCNTKGPKNRVPCKYHGHRIAHSDKHCHKFHNVEDQSSCWYMPHCRKPDLAGTSIDQPNKPGLLCKNDCKNHSVGCLSLGPHTRPHSWLGWRDKRSDIYHSHKPDLKDTRPRSHRNVGGRLQHSHMTQNNWLSYFDNLAGKNLHYKHVQRHKLYCTTHNANDRFVDRHSDCHITFGPQDKTVDNRLRYKPDWKDKRCCSHHNGCDWPLYPHNDHHNS